MGHDNLLACLTSVAAVELAGTRLLQAGERPETLPCDQLKDAVQEIIAYTGRCQRAASRLACLQAVPLADVGVPYFGV